MVKHNVYRITGQRVGQGYQFVYSSVELLFKSYFNFLVFKQSGRNQKRKEGSNLF